MEMQELQINKVKLGKNSRLNVKEEDLSSLMKSIKHSGLLQPIGVVKNSKKTFDVIYGNRRFLACSKLGYTKIPAVILKSTTKADMDIKNLAENIQRKNISLIETGRYMSALKKTGMKTPEIAVSLGVTKSYVTSCIDAYSKVPPKWRDKVSGRTAGVTVKKGNISVSNLPFITNSVANYNLTGKQKDKLYTIAAEKADVRPVDIKRYAKDLSMGNKVNVKTRRVRLDTLLTLGEYNRLKKKHITNGKFKTMGKVYAAILTGKLKEQVKLTKV